MDHYKKKALTQNVALIQAYVPITREVLQTLRNNDVISSEESSIVEVRAILNIYVFYATDLSHQISTLSIDCILFKFNHFISQYVKGHRSNNCLLYNNFRANIR